MPTTYRKKYSKYRTKIFRPVSSLRRRGRARYPVLRRSIGGIKIPNVHNFKRTVSLTNSAARWGSTTNQLYDTLTNYTIAFRLNDVPNVSEFTALFDEYFIYKVVLDIRPYRSESNITTSSTTNSNTLPYIHYCLDYDDDSSLSTVEDYQQYNTYKRMSCGDKRMVTIYPKMAQDVFISGVSTGYSSKRGYVDCGSGNVPHYGFKFGINGSGLGVTTSFAVDIEATFYIKFKGVR